MVHYSDHCLIQNWASQYQAVRSLLFEWFYSLNVQYLDPHCTEFRKILVCTYPFSQMITTLGHLWWIIFAILIIRFGSASLAVRYLHTSRSGQALAKLRKSCKNLIFKNRIEETNNLPKFCSDFCKL